ncbi:MAG: hypothetical protein RL199_424 [Pseudomonadota bacterium]|jgi:PAS domain S-box-containing protein
MTHADLNIYVLESTALVACGPVVLVSAWLLRRHRQPFFAEWVRGYTATFLLLAFDYAHLRTEWEPFLLLTGVAGFVNAFYFLRTFDRIRGRPPTSVRPLAGLALVLFALRMTGVIPLIGLVIATALIIALLSCLLGLAMLQTARRENPASGWVAVPFVLKGLWVFAYPAVSRHGLAPLGYWLDGLLHVATGLGMLVFVLERSAGEMSLVRDSTPGHAFLTVDPEGRLLAWNAGAERMLGWKASHVVGRSLTEALRPREDGLDDAPSEAWRQAMLRAEGGDFEVWLACAGGRSIWCRTSSVLASGGIGQSRVVVMVHDVTERRAAEARMRSLMTAIEQTPEGIVLADAEGRVQYVNPAFEQLAGLPAEAMRGLPVAAVGREEATARSGDPLVDAVRERRPWVGRIEGARHADRAGVEEAAVTPIRARAQGVTGFLLRRRDVTAEVALRDKLRHAQKLEAFGRLAAGVAHDFGNLMTIVAAQNGALTSPDARPETVAEARRANERAVERAQMLIRQLLAYSRRSAGRPQVVDLNAQAMEAVRMLGRVVGEDLELLVRPAVRRAAVRIDPGQLEQVIVNLVLNARDALAGRGRVVLATVDGADGSVELTVTDDGPGIAPEKVSRVFEPFFTTKTTGTGLGLSIVSEIVQEAGGGIAVESRVGQGTTFRVRLPVCEKAAAPSAPGAVRGHGTGARGTVLVVEDEEDLLSAMRANLVRSGFDVLTANSVSEGLAVEASHPGRIDLLLTDLTMPGGSGRELAEALVSRRPGLPVLFMSGYSSDAAVFERRSGLGEFIAKPFVFDELVRRLEVLLATPSA